MGKEEVTLEVDAALMSRLREAGVEPSAYFKQIFARQEAAAESAAARAERIDALRTEMKAGLDAYDELVEQGSDWSAELRTF